MEVQSSSTFSNIEPNLITLQGNPSNPQGRIDFDEITNIETHSDSESSCPVERSKGKKRTHCLHFVTSNRTFHLLGFESKEMAQHWKQTIQRAVQSHLIQQKARKWIEEHSGV